MNAPTSPRLSVSRAELSHVGEIAPLFDGYRQFYGMPSDLRAAQEFIEERLQRRESVIYVAREGGDALGFMQLFPSFSSVSLQRLWILNDLFVAPHARGRGVGAALLREAKDLCRATPAKGILLETAQDNPARELYEREGWRLERAAYYFWTAG